MTGEEHAPAAEAACDRGPRALAVRWIVLGALALVAGVMLGDKLLLANVVQKDDGELRRAYAAQDRKCAGGEAPSEAEKGEFRSLALGNGALVAGFAVMLLFLPIAVGAAVGGLARSKLAATIAVAAGMLTGLAIEGVFAEWVRAGALGGAVRIAAALAIYAGLGALGGLAGKRLALRRAAR